MGKVADRVAEHRAWAKDHLAMFDEILNRFEIAFGAENIDFQLADYGERFGIAYTRRLPDDQIRIAFAFPRGARNEHAEAAISYLRQWLLNPVSPPGVPGDNTLVGNEINVVNITLDPNAPMAGAA
jgi:hypothetical protein